MAIRDIVQAAAGVGGGGANEYVEDVFSTYLYTGNGSTQTINNGIKLGDAYLGGNVYFNGASAYLSKVSGAEAIRPGTGNFTFEFWYKNSAPNNYGVLFEFYEPSIATQRIAIQHDSASTNIIFVVNGGVVLTTSGGTPFDGQWHHHAAVRNGSNLSYYIDGSSVGSVTNTTNINTGTSFVIGRYSPNGYYINGYLSNFHVVTGTAIYTSNFTPPTTARTAISGTSLLTCQGNTPFVDNSNNAYVITVNGNAEANTGYGEGGLVWLKNRGFASAHSLHDTERTPASQLNSNTTLAATTLYGDLSSFNSNGFSLGTAGGGNNTTGNVASWTFRKAPKFFDVVTYTGNGVNTRTVAHDLGSTPGMIIVKCTSQSEQWRIYHRSLGATKALAFNTSAESTSNIYWNDTAPTSTEFSVYGYDGVNGSGKTYVAYLFAHDAGGFGDDGEQNVISCGSYTGNGSATGPVINLGWEPQWLLIKSTGVKDWVIYDTMRGLTVSSSNDEQLFANTADPTQFANRISPTATGFEIVSANADSNSSGVPYIYIAIRRPMKTPEAGTEVFNVQTYSGNEANDRFISTGFPIDANLTSGRQQGLSACLGARLYDGMHQTDVNGAGYNTLYDWIDYDFNTGYELPTAYTYSNASGSTFVTASFKRAPGFMDVVCYTGTGNTLLVYHNLQVSPELVILKRRDNTADWLVTTLTNGSIVYSVGLNSSSADDASLYQGTAYSSPTYIGVRDSNLGSINGAKYVAYLFATLAGVSKVGSYTGTGGSLDIDCNFSAGARFILIKRTDSTGDWYVWDSARGIVAGNDHYLLMNTPAAEVTNTDYIDPLASGFTVTSSAPADLNASGGTYIFLAIA
tara:strand:+ start:2206 stop:4770 length:2565 start_codon:yes stop_codon:yes gene_type:complete